jgi:uncharacterized protein (DUF1810 family)
MSASSRNRPSARSASKQNLFGLAVGFHSLRAAEVTALMLACDGVSATGVLGSPDDLKFRSSLTLFGAVATSPADRELFKAALARFFGGAPDSATLTILEAQGRR